MTRTLASFTSTIFLAIILVGCSTTSIVRTDETVVRDTTITLTHDTTLTVAPPEIRDTLDAVTNEDSTVTAVEVNPITKDTTAIVHYSSKKKKVSIYVKPDSVKVMVHDTLSA